MKRRCHQGDEDAEIALGPRCSTGSGRCTRETPRRMKRFIGAAAAKAQSAIFVKRMCVCVHVRVRVRMRVRVRVRVRARK